MGFIAFLLYSIVLFFFGAYVGMKAEQKNTINDYKQGRPSYIDHKVYQLQEILNAPNEDPDRNKNEFPST